MSFSMGDHVSSLELPARGATSFSYDDGFPPSARSGGSDEGKLLRRATDPKTPEEALARLHVLVAEHPFWKCQLLVACEEGSLTLSDLRLFFSQYYLYSRSFTRYVAALMANCDSDLHRAQLSENLWDEGGAKIPEQRHAEIFRTFLRNGLGIDIDAITFMDSTRLFVREYLSFCLHSPPLAGAAFLSLGTEGIVPRMYSVFVGALLKAGVPEEALGFFRLHIQCDDEHARTLEHIMMSHFNTVDWFATCARAMDFALRLRKHFFDQMFEAMRAERLSSLLANIQERVSLLPSVGVERLRHTARMPGRLLYQNVNERLGINFHVERVPVPAEVFDARLLHIAPRSNTELHRHPHESLFYVLRGEGRVRVDEAELPARAGDILFVPRWSQHQSFNLGDEELCILAVTDFGLTERAFIGDHLKTTRALGTQAPR